MEQRRNGFFAGASENAEKITKAAKLARQKEAVMEVGRPIMKSKTDLPKSTSVIKNREDIQRGSRAG